MGLTMKGQLVIVVFLASAILLGCQAQTTGRPTCPEIECPNEKPEGGMFARGDCLAEFCDCSYGTPYLLKCEDPLVFDEANQVCKRLRRLPEIKAQKTLRESSKNIDVYLKIID